MDSPFGQSVRTRAPGGATRQRLLRAAAELIAEIGWGRVTTRTVADRAGLPHGAVSYHFRGKQDLLTQAALETVEHIAPMGELEAVETLADLVSLITAWASDRDSFDPMLTGLLMEAMRESERNTALRRRLVAILRDYRRLLAYVVDADRQREARPPGSAQPPAPEALATLIAAAGDGLLLHGLLDPELDLVEAVEALGALLGQEASA